MSASALETFLTTNVGMEKEGGGEVSREEQGADYVWCRSFMGNSWSN